MIQHTLADVPSFCLDMLHKTTLGMRTEHRKVMQEVRYVKPIMLLCLVLDNIEKGGQTNYRLVDHLLHLVDTHNKRVIAIICLRILKTH